MNKLKMLTRYKSWADRLMLSALAELPDPELTAARPIVFGSILRTLNHVYAMDQVWKAHLQGKPHGYTTRNPEYCPDLNELSTKQHLLNDWYTDYADALAEPEHGELVEFEFIGGGPGAMSREHILLHVVNHATYHRGHVAGMLYNCGVAPPTTDLPVFLTHHNGPVPAHR